MMTKEQCLAEHPWPKEYASERRLEWFWQFEVPLAASELWRLVADSSRFNRALHVSEMKFEERDGQRWGSSRPGGIPHEWVEVPWNWVAERWMESVRIYTRGFSRVVYAVYVLTPLSDESKHLSIYFGAVPSGVVSGALLKLDLRVCTKTMFGCFRSWQRKSKIVVHRRWLCPEQRSQKEPSRGYRPLPMPW